MGEKRDRGPREADAGRCDLEFVKTDCSDALRRDRADSDPGRHRWARRERRAGIDTAHVGDEYLGAFPTRLERSQPAVCGDAQRRRQPCTAGRDVVGDRALSAWRAEAIRSAGGFTSDTVAEDTDLTIAIRRNGWRIVYDEDAIGWTEAPETAEALIRQRFRWTFGTLQAFWKHRDTLARPRYGTLGFVALPNIFLFQLLLPLVSPVIDLMFLSSLLLWGLSQFRMTHVPQLWTAADLERSVIFFLAFMTIDLLTCVIAFLLERHEDWSLLWPLLLQRFYYRQMMYVVLFRAVKRAVQGSAVGWRGVEPEVREPVAQILNLTSRR